ncbi:MAG TPA: pyrrolo-quinoline quinone, partial [Rhizobiales bacterium]|nr:pyrrolo-quinoline quinone [Hyphomicrobiales bacterium]
MSLAGCSGPLAGIRNPFAKKKEILLGERIPVITDPSLANVDPVLAGKPIALPPAQANASWTQPGGTPSNNLGHLAPVSY